MDTFSFNGRTLSELGAVITEPPHYEVAVRELENISIPGKSGDIIIDKERFKNVLLKYKVTHVPTLSDLRSDEFVTALSAWLLTVYNYCELRDTYNAGYFRKAFCTSIGSPTAETSNAVETTITFDCAPFWYSDSGTHPVVLTPTAGTAQWQYHNPEAWAADPVIRIEGSGDFVIAVTGAKTILLQISDVDGGVIIDTPHENVTDFSGSDVNDLVSGNLLPYLSPGSGTVTISGENAFTATLIPNWRRL